MKTVIAQIGQAAMSGGAGMTTSGRPWIRAACVLVSIAGLAGCFSKQIYPTNQDRSISLRAGDLERAGLAFITPSTATGQEEEKQAVALVFAEVLKQERPTVSVVALADTLGAVNRNGLSDAYKRMYEDYRDTGLFSRDMLKRVSMATGARYIAQIKLQGFQQGAKERFGIFGLRIVETRFANVRLFLQVWDGDDGSIAWEGMQEMVYSRDRVREEPITMHTAIEETTRNIIKKLP
jgi:hypothetical protein